MAHGRGRLVPPMPSIDFVNGTHTTGGVFVANLQVFRAARELGFMVHWVDCIDPSAPGDRFEGGEVVRGTKLPVSALEMGFNRFWTFPRSLRNRQSDWIFLGDPTFIRVVQASRTKRSIVRVSDLRPLTPYLDRISTRWMFRYAIPRVRNADRIVVYTDYLRSELEGLQGFPGRVHVLPPYAEVERPVVERHIAGATERRARNTPVTVIYVATDRPYKNVRFFLELATCLEHDTDPPFKFLLISRKGRNLDVELRRRNPPNLSLIDSVPDIGAFYERSDILAFPSLAEGFGLPLLEAMAHGLPVVSNDINPLREVVGSGGSLLPVSDLVPWAERLRALKDPQIYRRAAEQAADRALHFSYARFTKGVRELFK